MSAEDIAGIADIKVVKRATYLAATLSTDPAETKTLAWKQAKKSVPFLNKGLRRIDQTIRENLQVSLARSVLFYHAASLVAAEMWLQKDIDRMETTLYRKVYGVNNSIPNEAIITIL